MPEILKLQGGPAHSAGRLNRLTEQARTCCPGLKALAAEHWYFVELAAAISVEESQRLSQLLGVNAAAAAPAGQLLLVTPRLGTI